MPEQLTNEIRATLAACRSQLEYLADLGIESQNAAVSVGAQSQSSDTSAATLETLEAICADLGDCQRCGLASSRTKLVYGVGNPNARLVLVGEAPEHDDDLRGEPFVGEAGQLLDKILIAMGMQRSEVYLCNVLKCRPPNNRDPLSEEISTCKSFLSRQIAAIRPQAVIGLGQFAVQGLLKENTPISQLRGEWQRYQGIPLMPTYHPAYLLSHPEGKRDVWEDMKSVLRLLQSDGDG